MADCSGWAEAFALVAVMAIGVFGIWLVTR